MKAYIQANIMGMPINVSIFTAMEGFRQLGVETVLFNNLEELTSVADEDIVVGGVGTVKEYFRNRGCKIEDVDYPDDLVQYYGRKIWRTTSDDFLNNEINYPVFIKPVVGKVFTGFVCKEFKDLIGRIEPGENIDIYCSEVLKIRTEWRVFVRKSKILDIKRYNGELGTVYDLQSVKNMIENYKSSPPAYALDVAVTEDNKTVVVEINDGYSMGTYGLDPLPYAKLLYSWWAEKLNVDDVFDY